MNVEIKFLPDNRDGLVASGTYLLDAAGRLGIVLPTPCKGNAECDTCVVIVENGASSLSPPSEGESLRLGPERLAGGERIACLAKIEGPGGITIRLIPVAEAAAADRDLSKEFSDLPLGSKLKTLFELEAITAFDTLNTVIDLPFVAFGKLMDFAAKRGRALHERDLSQRRAAATIEKEEKKA